MACKQQNDIDAPFNPTRPLSTLDPAPSLVEKLLGAFRPRFTRTEPIRPSPVTRVTLWSQEVLDTTWEPYLYVITTPEGLSEARIWRPGSNSITLPFVPSLSDRSKNPTDFIMSLPEYKDANPDSKRNILPTVLYYHSHIHEGSGDSVNPTLLNPPTKHTFADNVTLGSWVGKLLCCLSPRKISSPYVSYGGSESKSPLVWT